MDCWVGGAAIRLFRYSSREEHSLEAYRNIRSLSSVALRNGRFCFAFSYPRAWERQTSTNSDGHTISHPEATSSPQSTAATGQWLHSSKLLAKHFPRDVWNGTLTSKKRRKPGHNFLQPANLTSNDNWIVSRNPYRTSNVLFYGWEPGIQGLARPHKTDWLMPIVKIGYRSVFNEIRRM
jgi:hypothetical protein